MDETRRRSRLRVVLGLLAVVAAVAAIWVTSAFAGDGPTANDRSSSDGPSADYVQSDGRDGAAPERDYPEKNGGAQQSSDV